MPLTFHEIEAARKAATFKSVPVPEWGGDVLLRKLGAAAYVSIADKSKAVPKDGQGNPTLSQETVDLYILMLSLSIVDQSGALIFRSPEARQFLRDEPFDVLDHLAAAAADLNELGDTEKKGTAPVS
mgnify:CR=1 FL=1